ncbi:MAG: hypothetical protein JWS10_4162 [Cypionkella sp.]|uniref:YbhB/YbcL family Raf kinase inhibitor-like protein n=1 Tax=Cypionkella sp. TaxID=2811411 RepID=UPI00260497CE|nr:YbhB/YbcL family Raf kinase inhibitor-like protein [Cypionkella sp.]MDB5661547.1 hypothetical protein [Cypionkella sp.]
MKPIVAGPVHLATSLLLLTSASAALAQVKGEVGLYSNATITGSVLEPSPIDEPDDAKLTSMITAPEGTKVEVFARDLINPRMLAVSDAGVLYATRRSVGDVVMLKDADGDGRADAPVTVASRPGMHGIAFAGDKVYLAAVNDVYVADVAEDGSFGALQRIINDLPDGGQHPNRTLGLGPDGMLYISAGSTCNACAETNPESATILRAKPDGSSRTIFASGLRNTIGFDWQPGSGQLWGMDHGIDWLGDDAQIEELNHIRQDQKYGWPYIFGMNEFNPQDNPPNGMSLETWAKHSTKPVLGYTAHSAPMQMAFYDGAMFPDWQGDAIVAMRGSWNRRPPSGYEVVRVDFERGQPVGIEPLLSGFLVQGEGDSYGYLGRLSGVAVAKDGAFFVSDDDRGIIYLLTSANPATDASADDNAATVTPDPLLPPPVSPIAFDMFATDATIAVKAGFAEDGKIPLVNAADGDNASPALSWDKAPEATQSYVIIADDPDAAEPKPFNHWVLYDLPASVTALREGLPTEPLLKDPIDAKQGQNDTGATGYFGPKPPVGDPPHHYHFQVFALDTATLDLDPGASRDAVLSAMRDHVIAKGQVVGLFAR